MEREQWKAGLAGLTLAGLLGVAIFVGSSDLRHIDAALVGYAVACLFGALGLGYRYSIWLRRPATRVCWKRGWDSSLRPGRLVPRLKGFLRRFVDTFMQAVKAILPSRHCTMISPLAL